MAPPHATQSGVFRYWLSNLIQFREQFLCDERTSAMDLTAPMRKSSEPGKASSSISTLRHFWRVGILSRGLSLALISRFNNSLAFFAIAITLSCSHSLLSQKGRSGDCHFVDRLTPLSTPRISHSRSNKARMC
jgi:hypothetical protein